MSLIARGLSQVKELAVDEARAVAALLEAAACTVTLIEQARGKALAEGKKLGLTGDISGVLGSKAGRLAAGVTGSNETLLAAERTRDAALHHLIKVVVDGLARLEPGKTLIVPSFHPCEASSAPKVTMVLDDLASEAKTLLGAGRGDGPDGGGWLFWVVHRVDAVTASVAICDTSQGSRFFPSRFNPLAGQLERKASVLLAGVAMERLADSAFWFLVLRVALHVPGLDAELAEQARSLYGKVVPFLNCRPVLANDHGAIVWRPTRGADGDFGDFGGHLCVLEAASHALRFAGVARPMGVELLLKAKVLAAADVGGATAEAAAVADAATRELARLAANQKDNDGAGDDWSAEAPPDAVLLGVASAVRERSSALAAAWAEADAVAAPPRLGLVLPTAAAAAAGVDGAFPLFDRAVRAAAEDVSKYGGTPQPKKIVRPVDLSLVYAGDCNTHTIYV